MVYESEEKYIQFQPHRSIQITGSDRPIQILSLPFLVLSKGIQIFQKIKVSNIYEFNGFNSNRDRCG